jgi:hypothetical protein
MTRLERFLLWFLVISEIYETVFDLYWSGRAGRER